MIKIGEFEVENFKKPYIVAEIGANFNGSIDLAKEMIQAAKDTGCNAAKFQSWSKESLLSKEIYENEKDTFYEDFQIKGLGNLLDFMALAPNEHEILFDYCNNLKIDFISSVFSKEEVDLLEKLNVKAFKIASMDLNNHDLIEYVAQKSKPILLSTGMGTIAEIDEAINLIERQDNDQIILLHCISNYPPNDQEINLNNISTFMNIYPYPIGFSDHTPDFIIPLAAIAKGISLLEKHFTLDRNLKGWDHQISAEPKDMNIIVEAANRIPTSLGLSRRKIGEKENEKRKSFRRSAVAIKKIHKGDIFTEKNIDFKRPGYGIPPNKKSILIGRISPREFKIGEVIEL